jgi:hypothetical protein
VSNPTFEKIYWPNQKKKLEKHGNPFPNFNNIPKKLYRDKSKKSKRLVIPPQRDNDTNTKVNNLRWHYKNGSYAFHPRFNKRVLFKRLKLTELDPICREIMPIGQYRFMDYTLHLDASCLNDNWADRNLVSWFSGLEMIKRVRSLTYDFQEKVWSWELAEPKIRSTDWARGLKYFPEFKNWALSFNHEAVQNLICTLEDKLTAINRLPFQVGNLIDMYEPDGPLFTSKRVVLRELNPKTLKFIKEKPYMSRMTCYNNQCPVPKLIQVGMNEK